MTQKDVLRLSIQVLVRLVRQEHPDGKSLADIALIWGDASADEIEALKALEVALQLVEEANADLA